MAERINRLLDAVGAALVIAVYVGLPVYVVAGVKSGVVSGIMAGVGSLMQTYNLHAPVTAGAKVVANSMIGH